MTIRASEFSNPFVGLRPFRDSEAARFFGRGDQTVELLSRLHDSRFSAVVGSSGCGKSSLVWAGLVPALKAGMLVGDRDLWYMATMRPGDRPWHNLARALLRAFPRAAATYSVESLMDLLFRHDVGAVSDIFGRPVADDNANLLLFVDQFEEIFRYEDTSEGSETVDDRENFVSLMLSIAEETNVPLYVVMTMRSDFIGECSQFRGLPEAVNKSIYLVPRLTRRQKKQAIEGPIRLMRQEASSQLVNRVLNDAGLEQDQLPIMQHAMMRTWEIWSRDAKGVIDLLHYEHEEVGGMEGALNWDAEHNAFLKLSEADRTIAAKVFQLLTDTDDSNRHVRRPTSVSVMRSVTGADAEDIERALQPFRDRSFVFWPDNGFVDETVVDISHESLIRQWTTLQRWVEEEADSASRFGKLEAAAAEYLNRENEEDESGLIRGASLDSALEWWEDTSPTDAQAARYGADRSNIDAFLQASKAARLREVARIERERELAETVKRQKGTRKFWMAIMVLSIGSTGLAIWLTQEAKEAQSTAEDQRTLADEQRGIAEQERATAEEQRGIAEQERATAEEQRGIAEQERATAEEQRGIAEEERATAEEQKEIAQQERARAEIEKDTAESLADSLEILQKMDADKVLGLLAFDLANASLSAVEAGDGGLAGLLARHAYILNSRAGGNAGPTVFKALTSSLNAIAVATGDEQTIPEIVEFGSALEAVAISNDGSLVAVAGEDGYVHVSQRIENRFRRFRAHEGRVKNVEFVGESLVTVGADGRVLEWSGILDADPTAVPIWEHSSAISALASYQSSGFSLVTAASRDSLMVFDMLSRVRTVMGLLGPARSIVFTDGGHEVFVAGNTPSRVLWATRQSSALDPVAGTALTAAAFKPVTGRVLFGDEEGMLLGYRPLPDSSTLEAWSGSLPAHRGSILAVAYDPARDQIATASADRSIRLWEVTVPTQLDGHEDWVRDIAFTANGDTLLSVSRDETLRIWPTNAARLARQVCNVVTRPELSDDEWKRFMGESTSRSESCSCNEDCIES